MRIASVDQYLDEKVQAKEGGKGDGSIKSARK